MLALAIFLAWLLLIIVIVSVGTIVLIGACS